METFANRYEEMPYEDMLKELTQEERLQLARERLKAGRDFDYTTAARKMLEAKAPQTRDDAAIAANDNWPDAAAQERQRLEGVNRMETAKAVGQAVAGQISNAEQELAESDAELLRRRKVDKRNLETASQGRWDYDYAETGNVAIPELKAISALKRAEGGNINADDIEKVKDEYSSHYDAIFASDEFQKQDKDVQQKAMQHRADMMQALADVQRGVRLTPEKLSLLEEASHAYNRFMLGTVRGLASVGKWVADAYAEGGALEQMPGVHGRTAKDDLVMSGASEKAGRLAEGAARAMKEDASAVESRAAQADNWNLNRAVSLGVSGTLSSATAIVGTAMLGPTAGLVSTIGVPTFGNSYAEADEALKRKYPTLSPNARFVLATQEAGWNAAVEIGTEYASDMLGLGVVGGVGMKRPVEAFMADTTKRGARKFFAGMARNVKNMAIGTFAEWMEEAVADPLEDLGKAYRGESEIMGALKGKDKAANLAGYIMTSWRDALLGVASIPLTGAGSAGLQAMQKRNNVTNALANPEFLKEFGVKSEYVTAQLSNAIRHAVVGDRQGAEGVMQTLEGMGKDELHNFDVNQEDVATARKIFDQVAKTTALGSNELLESLSANPLPYNGHARVDVAPIGDNGFHLVTASLNDEVIGMAVTPSREDALMLNELARTRWLGVESPNVKALDGARYAAKVDGKWMTFDQYGHKISEMDKALSTRMETEVARQLNKLPREYSLEDKDGNIGVHVGGPAMMNGRQISVNEWGRTADNRPQWMIRGNMDDLDWVRNNAEGLEFVPGDNENVLLVAGVNPTNAIMGASMRESDIRLGGKGFTVIHSKGLEGGQQEWNVYGTPEDLLWLREQPLDIRLVWNGTSNHAKIIGPNPSARIREAIDPNGEMQEEKIETPKSEPEAEWAATLPGHNPKRLVGYMKTLSDAERNAALKFFGDGETIAFYPDEDGEMKAGTRQQCVEDSVANGVALRDNGNNSYTFIYRNGVTMPVNKAAYDYAMYLRGEQPAAQPTAKPQKNVAPKTEGNKQTVEPPAQNPPNTPPAESPSDRLTQAVTAADVVGAQMDDLQAEVQELQSKVDTGRATEEDKARLADAKEEQAVLEELAASVPEEEKDTVSGKGTVRRLKVADIKVDPKRFQFKTGTDASGVERSNELTGDWDDKTAGNLYVWQDKNGDYYVVNGHHRLDLAKRKGVEEINAIVEREADGVTEEEAKRNGVMINIRDGQGSVEDYARFIHAHKMTEGQARAEGFFRGRKGGRGWQGWLIGSVASEALYSEFINGGIPADKAAAIAEVAKGDEGLEAASIRLAATMDVASLQEAVKALKNVPKKKPVQGDLFGFDDSAIRTAEAIGRLVAKRKAALRREIASVRGAVKRPDLAENLDVAVGSEASAMLQQKQQELERLEHYDTDHELYQELLKEATEQKPAEQPKTEPKKEEAKPVEQPKAEEKPTETKPAEEPKAAEKPVEQPAASNELTQEEIDSIPGTMTEKKKVIEYLNSLPADKREDAMKWLPKQARKSGNPRYKFVEGLIDKGYVPSDNNTMVSNNDTLSPLRLTAALHEYAKWLHERRQPQKQETEKPETTKKEDISELSEMAKEYLNSLPEDKREQARQAFVQYKNTDGEMGDNEVQIFLQKGFKPVIKDEANGLTYFVRGEQSLAFPPELVKYGEWLFNRVPKSGEYPGNTGMTMAQAREMAENMLDGIVSGGIASIKVEMPNAPEFNYTIKGMPGTKENFLIVDEGTNAQHSHTRDWLERNLARGLFGGQKVTAQPAEKTAEQQPSNVAQTQQNVAETQQPEPQPEPTDQPIKNNTFFDKPWLTEEEIRNSGVTDENMILAAIDYINGDTDNSVNQAAYVQVKIAIANKNKTQEFDPNTEKELHAILLSDKPSAQKRRELEDYANRHGIDVKAAQERVEEVLVTISTEISAMDISPREKFDRLVTLYNGQPTLDQRTSSSIINQAYSTPAPMAFALANRIRLADGQSIYEPAGGNGMLVSSAPRKNVNVNELQASRQAALKRQGFTKVTGYDATEYTPPGLYDREMMNPPFGNLDNPVFTDDGFKLTKLDHLIPYKALSALSENGKAGIIVGANTKNMGGKGVATPADWVFMNWLYKNFNVTENLIADGKLYERQGAGYPVRVIVIEGRRETPGGDEEAPREVEKVNTWDELWDRLNANKPTPSKPKPTTQAAKPSTAQEKPQAAKPTTQTATPAPAAEVPSVPVPKSADAEEDAIMADIMADLQAFSDAGKGLHMNLFGFNDGQIAALTKLLWHGAQLGFHYIQKGIRTFADWLDAMDKKLHAAFKAYGLSEDNISEFYQDVWNTQYTHDGQRHTLAMWASELGQTREVQAGEATGELNVRYQPASNSKPLDTVAPKYLADAMAASLNRLQEKVGNLDQYVMEQLGYDSLDELYDKLAGEQVDGVAMAINAMSNGDGFILGDQTGIGKGRQCAAVMRWAIRNGKIPIFVTERSNLFTDMYRDGMDVGIDFNPVIFAGSAEGNILDKDGQVVRRAMNAKARREAIANLIAGGNDHNAVFVTYSQVSMPGSGQRGELGELVTSRKCIVILDEAHNAAGNSNRGRYFMQFLRWPDLPVLYASATFAKRPDNMPIYFRTSLRKAVDDIEALPIAIRLGGVPLQQVVSRQLAEDGLFIRRERDFSGVEFENVSEEPPNYPEVLANHDRTVKVLQEMIEFSNLIRDILAQQNSYMQAHTREAVSIVSTPFSSVAHNYIAQLLLASKIDLVVERAIKSFKENEKPVIALTSTIESSIDNYMHDNGVQTGDRADMTYSDILLAALERMRRATRKSGNGQDVQEDLDFKKMGIQGQYLNLKNHIKALADIKYPVSPIDYLRYKLTQAGMKIGEITGRTGGIDYSGKVPVFYSRNAEDKNKNGNINGFNNGTLDALILNQSGSTGLSIHASIKFRDQRVRRMIMAQPSLDINVVMQMFGRIMRSGQVVLPKYEILSTPLAAEKRPHMILSQKMKSLNANTTANSRGIVDLGVDFLNEIGDQVANDMLIENPTLAARIGVPAVAVHTDDNGNTVGNLENMARKVSGKMAILTNSEQEKYYKEIQDRYEEQVELLKAAGEYKLEAEELDWEAEVASADTELSPGVTDGSMFEQPVLIRHLLVREKRKIPSWKSVQNRVEKNFDGKDVGEYIAGKLEEAQRIVAELPEKYAQLHADGIAGTAPDQARDVVDACSNLLAEVTQFFYDHPTDRVYILKAGEMEYQAYLTGFKLERANALRPFIPSRVKLEFMVDSNVGKINVPFSQIQNARYSFDPTFLRPEDVFLGDERVFRLNKTVIVGNLLRGFDAAQRGRIVNYTMADGAREIGILMPNNWSESDLAHDPRRDLSGIAEIMEELKRAETPDNVYISSDDGLIRINGYADKAYMVVGKHGGRYIKDETLISILGEFSGRRGSPMISKRVPIEGETGADMKSAILRLLDMGVKFRRELPDARQPQVNYKVSKTPETIMPTADARKVVNAMQKEHSVPIVLVEDETELPENLRRQIDIDRARGVFDNNKTWKGLCWGNRVYVNAEAAESAEDVVITVLHEAGVHAGLRAMFPDAKAFDAFLNEMHDKYGAIRALARQHEQTGANRLSAIEEAIADMADRYNHNPVWRQILLRVYDAIRNLLSKIGVPVSDLVAIRNVIRDAAMAVKKNTPTVENDTANYRLDDGVQSVIDVTQNGTIHRTVTDMNGDVLEVEMPTKGRRVMDNLRQTFKRYFSWGKNRGGVDASINEAMFRATSEIAAQNESHKILELALEEVFKPIINEPWVKQVHEAELRLWNGDFGVESLSEEIPHYDDPRVVAITEIVLQMRGGIDVLSHQTRNIAKINPAVQAVIDNNYGSYHFRAYRIHREKNWTPSEKVRNEAITAVADELMTMIKSTESAINQTIDTEYNNILNQLALSAYVRNGDASVLEGKSKRLRAKARMIRRLMERTLKAVNDGMTVAMNQGYIELRPNSDVISKTANGIIARLLDKNSNPQYVAAGSSAWKIIQTSFLRRKDLPQWLRELYGEVTDLGMQFEMTARRLTSIVVMDRMYRELAAFNEGLSKDDKQRSFYKTEYRRDGIDFMKKLEGPKFGALQGMYTDVNTYELLTGYENPESPIGKRWRQVVAWNRYMHTVGNPPTQLRNFLGNIAFAMNDGEFMRPTYLKYMYYAFKTLIGSDEAATKERQRLMRLGLIGSSAHGVEIFQTVEAMGLKPHEFELGELLSKSGRVMRVLRWLPRKLEAAYAMEDNIFRVAALYAKEARGESSEEAVERIRDLYPTYDQAPAAMAALSRYIPTGKDFLTFQAEAVRCYVNTFKYMVKDMKKGSAWSTAGALGVLALALPMVQTFIGSLFGDDDDDQDAMLTSTEFKALRMLLPEYMKDHAVIPWRTGKKIAYVDLGYIYPFDFLPTIFSVAMSNESMAVRAGDLAKDAMFVTFFGGMTSNLLAEQIVGRDARSGRKLSNVDRLEHIVSGMTPSSWHYAARAIKLAAAEEDELVRSSGEVQTAKSEASKTILPLRVYHKDMAASYLYKMRTQATEVKTEKARANLAWRRVESREGTRGDAEATQKAVQSRLEGDLYESIRLLNEAGAVYLSRGERMKLLRDAGFSLADIRAILDNKPIRYVKP